jgi:hypothetical protein
LKKSSAITGFCAGALWLVCGGAARPLREPALSRQTANATVAQIATLDLNFMLLFLWTGTVFLCVQQITRYSRSDAITHRLDGFSVSSEQDLRRRMAAHRETSKLLSARRWLRIQLNCA